VTFSETYKSLLSRPDFGQIMKREEHMKVIWNSALDAAMETLVKDFHVTVISEVKKLKA
jgi:hypothetical protein